MSEHPKIQILIDKANFRLEEEGKLIGELIKELNSVKREERATGILSEIYVNLLCSLCLSAYYKGKIDDYDKKTLSTNKKRLLKLQLISKDLDYDIFCLKKIRNLYAHNRCVKQPPVSVEINNWVKKTNTYQNLISLWKREDKAKTDFEAFLEVVNNIIKKLRRIHGKILTDRLNQLEEQLQRETP